MKKRTLFVPALAAVLVRLSAVMVFLGLTVAFRLPAADGYLPRTGPVPLRFGRLSDKANTYKWPVSLPATLSSTNSVQKMKVEESPQGTFASPSAPNQLTEPETGAMTEPTFFPTWEITTNLDETPIPAGKLLIVTPEMLAEFLRNVPGARKAATNRPPEADGWFMPPLPAVPAGSEAIYRTQ